MKLARKLLLWIPLSLYILYTIFVWVEFLITKADLNANPDQAFAGLGLALILVYFVIIFYSALCVINIITSIIGLVLTKKLNNSYISCSKAPFILTMVLPIITEVITIIVFLILT